MEIGDVYLGLQLKHGKLTLATEVDLPVVAMIMIKKGTLLVLRTKQELICFTRKKERRR